MKWFKHMTHSWQDEKMVRLLSEKGMEGYGFYWRMVEVVASNMGDGALAVYRSSPAGWARVFQLMPKRWARLAQGLADCGLILLEEIGTDLQVSIPNIVKYRDEYSRKKQPKEEKTPDKLRTDSGQTPERKETEQSRTEAEKEKENKAPPAPPPEKPPAAPPVSRRPFTVTTFPPELDTPEFREAWSAWEKFRREKKCPVTETMVRTQMKAMIAWGVKRSIAAINHTIFKGWQGLREPDQMDAPRGQEETWDQRIARLADAASAEDAKNAKE